MVQASHSCRIRQALKSRGMVSLFPFCGGFMKSLGTRSVFIGCDGPQETSIEYLLSELVDNEWPEVWYTQYNSNDYYLFLYEEKSACFETDFPVAALCGKYVSFSKRKREYLENKTLKGEFCILRLYTPPQNRRRGYGSILCDFLRQLIHGNPISLYVAAISSTLGFWRRRGFAIPEAMVDKQKLSPYSDTCVFAYSGNSTCLASKTGVKEKEFQWKSPRTSAVDDGEEQLSLS